MFLFQGQTAKQDIFLATLSNTLITRSTWMGGVAHLLEGVALSRLLYRLQDILVDPEAEGDS